MSSILAPRPLQLLNPKPRGMLTFLTERARLKNFKYVVGGASALKLHGAIERQTEDVDFYIPAGRTPDFSDILRPHLDEQKQERVTFPGLANRWTDPEAIQRATKMKVYYRHNLWQEDGNAKADISESPDLLEEDDKFVVKLEDSIRVASVPVLMVFKLCAMCCGSRNGRQDRLQKDIHDLVACLKHLIRKRQSIPLQVQGLLQRSEDFSWETLRNLLDDRVPEAKDREFIQRSLIELGFPSINVKGI